MLFRSRGATATPPPERARTPQEAPPPEPQRAVALPARPEPETAPLRRPPVLAQPAPPAYHPDRQFIQQHHEGNDPPPEHPRFLARDNRRVEEETVARARATDRDDRDPQLGGRRRADAAQGAADEGDSERNASGVARTGPSGREDARARGRRTDAQLAAQAVGRRSGDDLARTQAQPPSQRGAPGERVQAPSPDQGELATHDAARGAQEAREGRGASEARVVGREGRGARGRPMRLRLTWSQFEAIERSEERRVGKECRL